MRLLLFHDGLKFVATRSCQKLLLSLLILHFVSYFYLLELLNRPLINSLPHLRPQNLILYLRHALDLLLLLRYGVLQKFGSDFVVILLVGVIDIVLRWWSLRTLR